MQLLGTQNEEVPSGWAQNALGRLEVGIDELPPGKFPSSCAAGVDTFRHSIKKADSLGTGLSKSGEGSGARTPDQEIKSLLLYQLS